ncbi:MAG: serine/threonine-protein kinase PknK [Alphaproteobacteria bacterium]|nr:serine/threonine-protein kinase PknK [Alphaproteobacteria bacterium]
MPSPIPLGPFDLLRRIGGGGMGEVWEGVHRAQRLPVAVKVLPQVGDGLERLRAEVRAMARLDHPCVAAVYDMGVLPAEAAVASRGQLEAGSPYLVLERCHGGDLVPWCGRLPWSAAHALLRALLEALAHAHARGVVHRDIKPSNVLLGSWQDLRPGPKLIDFGIAWSLQESGALPQAGTPAYMAPEQRAGGEQGPWTDLYALGRLALALLTGSPNPTLAPVGTPEGLLPWVARLLRADPRERYACAADAADALRALPAGEGASAILEELGVDPGRQLAVDNGTFDGLLDGLTTLAASSEPTWDGLSDAAPPRPAFTHDGLLDGATTPIDLEAGGAPVTLDVTPAPRSQATPPADWRRETAWLRPPLMLGTGLSLHGLRAVPLVGREAQQDALWRALLEVVEAGVARVSLLHGPAGSGRGHLARWLGEQAEELGVACVVELGEGARPLAAGLRRALRGERLGPNALADRLRAALGDDPLALAEALSLISEDPARACAQTGLMLAAFKTPAERVEAAVALLERLAGARPVVLLAPRAAASSLVLRLLGRLGAGRAPIFALGTVRDEELAAPSPLLTRLLGGPVELVEVGPLTPDAHDRLIQEALGFSGALGDQVARRTAGNPQLALLTLDHLVRDGLVEPGPRGFRLTPGASLHVPADLHGAWGSASRSSSAACLGLRRWRSSAPRRSGRRWTLGRGRRPARARASRPPRWGPRWTPCSPRGWRAATALTDPGPSAPPC